MSVGNTIEICDLSKPAVTGDRVRFATEDTVTVIIKYGVFGGDMTPVGIPFLNAFTGKFVRFPDGYTLIFISVSGMAIQRCDKIVGK